MRLFGTCFEGAHAPRWQGDLDSRCAWMCDHGSYFVLSVLELRPEAAVLLLSHCLDNVIVLL